MIKVRFGRSEDLKSYLSLQKKSFPSIDSIRDRKLFLMKLDSNEVFVAAGDGKYLGHLCFGKHLIAPPFAKSVFIEELAVDPEARGKGVGRLLVQKLAGYCRTKKIPVIYLGTADVKHCGAKTFYEKMGFKQVGRLDEINPDSEYDYGQLFYATLVKNL